MMQDGRGCVAEQGGFMIAQSQPMNLYIGEDTIVPYGDVFYNLQVSITSDPNYISSVIWQQDGEVICDGFPDQCFNIQVNPEGINTYCVTLIDIYGCESTDCVIIEEELQAEVYIPNVLNPSLESNNNRFYIQGGEYITSVKELRVFDRWGNAIFVAQPDHEPNDPQYGWDGTKHGNEVLPGVYVYFAITTNILGEEEKHCGDVTLLK